MVFDLDLVETALIDKPLVLVIADLAFFTSLKLLPGLLFDHGGVGIEVLTLKSDFLQLLSETSLFCSLRRLLLLNLAMSFEQTFLTSCFGPRRQSYCIVLLFLSAGVILSLAASTSLFNLGSFLHKLLSFLLFASHVSLTLEFNILILLPLLELKSLTQLSNRHFLHEAMTTSLSWIKALRSLDRDLLELANLTNQFHLFRKLSSFLILALL